MATTFNNGLIFNMDASSLDTPSLGDNRKYTLADLEQLEPLTTVTRIIHPIRTKLGTSKPLVGRSN